MICCCLLPIEHVIEASHPVQLGFSLPLLTLDCTLQPNEPHSRKYFKRWQHAISAERACGAV
jgi:hypothetical protein